MPCSPFNNKEVDEDFKTEFDAAKLHGFSIKLFDFDEFVSKARDIINIPGYEPSVLNEALPLIIYRGWMLLPYQYQILQDFFKEKYKLINTTEQYQLCHHAPGSYPYITERTPKMVSFLDVTEGHALLSQFTDKVLLKDYVKSDKGKDSLSVVSVDSSKEDLEETLLKFKEKRGRLFETGFVFKQFVPLKKYTIDKKDTTNEWRLFFFDKKLLSVAQNSNLPTAERPNLYWVYPLVAEIPSNMFTIDIAELEDGSWTIIETGDGQVSGLASEQNALEFYAKLKEILN